MHFSLSPVSVSVPVPVASAHQLREQRRCHTQHEQWHAAHTDEKSVSGHPDETRNETGAPGPAPPRRSAHARLPPPPHLRRRPSPRARCCARDRGARIARSSGARTNWQRCTCSGRNAGLVAEGGAVAGRGRRVVPRAVPAGTRLACTRRPGRWRRRDWRAHRDSALSASTSAARVCANPGPHRRLTSPCARARVSGPTSSMARTQTARTAMGRGVNLCSSAPSARNCLQAGASWRRMPVRVPSVRVKPATLDPRTCARSACLSASLSRSRSG